MNPMQTSANMAPMPVQHDGPTSATQFPVGTMFKSAGKHPRTCIVEDMLTTRNLAGEVVRIRYVATHEFMGQKVTDSDVSPVTIARGLVSSTDAEPSSPAEPEPLSPVEQAEEKARQAFPVPEAQPLPGLSRPLASVVAMPLRRGAVRLGGS